jgi:outer membrane protein OmpA-like peptidoglycan-associated protein
MNAGTNAANMKGRGVQRLPVAGWAAAAVLLALAACTTTPERIAELDQARATVETLESHPMARQAASAQLTKAREALRRADTAVENGEPLELIRHEAYLARRNAEVGLQMTSEAEAAEAISQGEVRRQEVQLQARTVEAERAQRLAEQRAMQAERSAQEAEASQSIAEAAISEANRLAEELNALEGELEAQQTERGLVLTLGDVLFDTAGSDLKEGAEVSMDRLAAFLKDNPERRLLVEGHTDARGSEEFNRELSGRRADAVTEALVQRGIPSERLRSAGLGEGFPVASNDTSAGMQQNRRVEIVVSNPDGSFPALAEQRAVATSRD